VVCHDFDPTVLHLLEAELLHRAKTMGQKQEICRYKKYVGSSMISVGKKKYVGLGIYMPGKSLCVGERGLPSRRGDPGCKVLAPKQR
jgi:hypothetical protein